MKFSWSWSTMDSSQVLYSFSQLSFLRKKKRSYFVTLSWHLWINFFFLNWCCFFISFVKYKFGTNLYHACLIRSKTSCLKKISEVTLYLVIRLFMMHYFHILLLFKKLTIEWQRNGEFSTWTRSRDFCRINPIKMPNVPQR